MLLMEIGNNLLKPKDGKPGKMYRMINTCNYRNSARIVTRTAFKKPSIFIEKLSLHKISENRHKNTRHKEYVKHD